MNALAKAWEAFRCRSFPPGHAGEEIAGHCLAQLDADTAAFIPACLRMVELGKPFVVKHIQIFDHCKTQINVVLPALEGEAKDRFLELLRLVDMVLKKDQKNRDNYPVGIPPKKHRNSYPF